MLAFRAVVSVLVSFVWGLSLRTQGRPCGRPPAAAVLTPATTPRVTGTPASPSQQVVPQLPAAARVKGGDRKDQELSQAPPGLVLLL